MICVNKMKIEEKKCSIKYNFPPLKGFATFWEFSFYGQKKVADYEYHSLFAEKIHFHT